MVHCIPIPDEWTENPIAQKVYAKNLIICFQLAKCLGFSVSYNKVLIYSIKHGICKEYLT